MNRRTFLKITGIILVSLALPAISLSSETPIFDYYKPFELGAVYVFFKEDHMKEYSITLKNLEDEIINEISPILCSGDVEQLFKVCDEIKIRNNQT